MQAGPCASDYPLTMCEIVERYSEIPEVPACECVESRQCLTACWVPLCVQQYLHRGTALVSSEARDSAGVTGAGWSRRGTP